MQVEQLRTISRIAREQSGPVGPTRHDLVLAVIALSLAASVAAGAVALPWRFALAGGGVVAVAATTYGLFVDPPAAVESVRDRTPRSGDGGN
ncbi:hypothetical protein [Halobacterium zhouii]|uniref:hypothetical protein n=1 Tax=Halobacterium zhouii TaxID=2902624 RepID=UPI001E646696|nr:hypothetical protein [Halobacterium zhouii]